MSFLWKHMSQRGGKKKYYDIVELLLMSGANLLPKYDQPGSTIPEEFTTDEKLVELVKRYTVNEHIKESDCD